MECSQTLRISMILWHCEAKDISSQTHLHFYAPFISLAFRSVSKHRYLITIILVLVICPVIIIIATVMSSWISVDVIGRVSYLSVLQQSARGAPLASLPKLGNRVLEWEVVSTDHKHKDGIFFGRKKWFQLFQLADTIIAYCLVSYNFFMMDLKRLRRRNPLFNDELGPA